jgi:hypothetical protein
MGKDSEWIEASGGSSENYGLDSCEAQDVPICSQKDRSRTAGKVGED